MSLIKLPGTLAHRGNMSVKSVPTQDLRVHESPAFSILAPRYIALAIFGSAYILSFILNLRVIYVVYSRMSKKVKARWSTGLLVAHLALVCIGTTVLSVLKTCQSKKVLSYFGPEVCLVSDFLEETFICAFSLNTLLLVYERVRTISGLHEPLYVIRLIGLVWSLSSTQGLFTMAFMYHKKLELPEFRLGAQIAGISCEAIRFVIFHLGVGISTTYAIVKVHYKLTQLPSPCQRLKRKMENIRLFYVHLSIFVLAWIFYGVWHAAQRVAFFLEFNLQHYDEMVDNIDLGFHTYLTLNPMLHMLLLDNEMSGCPKKYMCLKGHFMSDDHFEEETFTGILDDERNTTIRATSSGAMEDEKSKKSSESCTIIRELSGSPIKYGRHNNNPPPQMYVQTVYLVDKLDIDYIDAESEKESSIEEEYKVAEKKTKVRFCDPEDIAYYEDDHLDDSEAEETSTSGEYETSVFETMETAL